MLLLTNLISKTIDLLTPAQTFAKSRQLVRATDSLDVWTVSPYFSEKTVSHLKMSHIRKRMQVSAVH